MSDLFVRTLQQNRIEKARRHTGDYGGYRRVFPYQCNAF